MPPRFYAPAARADGDVVPLPPDEAHHLLHVLRLREGAAVRVFDGRGREWDATVAAAGRDGVVLARGAARAPAPEPPVRVVLALGVLKPDYMELAVRNAVMVGAAAIQPLVTAHSVRPARDVSSAAVVDRWRRIALSAVKQCGRAVVPEVFPLESLAAWLPAGARTMGLKILLAEPALASTEVLDVQASREIARREGAILLVGPEGGWHPDEVSGARAVGFAPWTVSRRILRADAAALAAVSVLLYLWD